MAENTKYISFSPYFSGLANVIMSYEVFLAAAAITNRRVILPPNCWFLFICKSQNKKDWKDIWQIFDKNILLEEFDCIEHNDVPEFSRIKNLISSRYSYTSNIKKGALNVKSIVFESDSTDGNSVTLNHRVLTNGVLETEDFKKFCSNREIVDIKCNDKFLHFENNLFGHYWYNVYPGGEDERNKLKDKINRVMKYHDKFYRYADVVRQKIGKFNAIHVRRNDFLDTRPDSVKKYDSSHKILNVVKELPFFDPSLPIYISTDEKNRNFFKRLSLKYDIYFYDDFDFEFGNDYVQDDLHEAVLEQVICSQSENFFGTYYSTFTKRINIIRGLSGRQAHDWMGINHMPEGPDENLTDVLPWRKMENKRWEWNSSSHIQWTKEIDGKLVNEYLK